MLECNVSTLAKALLTAYDAIIGPRPQKGNKIVEKDIAGTVLSWFW